MYSDEDLDSAVAAGVLSSDAATALRAHVARARQAPLADEERFRLVTGFNDIFVVIACILLMASVGWIGAAVTPVLGMAAVAVTAWMLAEFFVRRRRMALPAIVLLLAFVGGAFASGFSLLGGMVGGAAGGGALAVAAAWLHWTRFRVPITVAAGCAAAIACAIALLLSAVPGLAGWIPAFTFAAGVAVFAVAMRWDAADTLRQTRRADIAFWLHLLAAPLLVHPVFSVLGIGGAGSGLGPALAVLLLYVALALVSLAIDRRALMVSALGYVLYTFSALLKEQGMVGMGFAITALVIGSALLLLSAFWHRARAALLARLGEGMRSRVPLAR